MSTEMESRDSEKDCPDNQPKESAEDKVTAKSPGLESDQKTAVAKSDTSDSERKKSRGPDFWTAWATVAIALFTIVLAIVSYRQWRELQGAGQQTDQMIELYRQQLDQLQHQASDTRILAETAYINARPWIAIVATNFQFRDPISGTQPLRAEVFISDTGPTPARSVRILACGAVRQHNPSADDYRLSNRSCVRQSGGLIGKGVSFGFDQDDTSNTVTKDKFATSTHDPGWHYYVWGTVTYDVSPKDVNHTTSFCLLSGPDRFQMGTCTTGNHGN
jgi:hypothetical protein